VWGEKFIWNNEPATGGQAITWTAYNPFTLSKPVVVKMIDTCGALNGELDDEDVIPLILAGKRELQREVQFLGRMNHVKIIKL